MTGDYNGGGVPLEPAATRTRANAGGTDAFVARFSPTFAYQWGRLYGGSGSDYAWAITDARDGVLVAGRIASDVVDFGAEGAPDRRESSAGDVFVLGLGPKAEYRGVFTLTPPRAAVPSFLRRSQNTVLFGGFFSGSVDFDPGVSDQDVHAAAPVRSAYVSRFGL